ncbi:MAG TPA: response regulator [Trueperaceae bacterium]
MAKILVADDIAGQRMVLDMLLSVDGYDVHMVEDGAEALAFLKENTPDLAIIDVRMPNVDGITVCARMKRVSRLKDVPVVILTALKDATTYEAARNAGADAIVHKPLEGKDFRQTVKDLLAGAARPAQGEHAAG